MALFRFQGAEGRLEARRYGLVSVLWPDKGLQVGRC